MIFFKNFFAGVVLFFCLGINVFGATPFDAPSEFILTGSNISSSLAFQTKLGNVNASLNPNPAPVTGKIIVNSLNKSSGAFYGKFEDVSASTTVSGIASIGNITATLTINSPVSGMFLWAQNKVVINAEYLTAVLSLNGQDFPIALKGAIIPANYNNGVISLNFNIDQGGTYGSLAFSFSGAVNLTGVLNYSALGGLWIEMITSKMNYQTGNYFDLYVSLGNSGPESNVDLYFGLLNPNGELLVMQPDLSFSTNITPVLSDFNLPNGTLLSNTQIFHTLLPSTTPPVSIPGKYTLLAGFTDIGTLDFIGDIFPSSFEYAVQTSSGNYDGLYIGSAFNSTSSSTCAGINLVTFYIVNNLIEGEAEEQQGQETEGYPVTGVVNETGKIVNGIIWEEYMTSLIAIGTLDGQVSGETIAGTWTDSYGCYGTYTLTKHPID